MKVKPIQMVRGGNRTMKLRHATRRTLKAFLLGKQYTIQELQSYCCLLKSFSFTVLNSTIHSSLNLTCTQITVSLFGRPTICIPNSEPWNSPPPPRLSSRAAPIALPCSTPHYGKSCPCCKPLLSPEFYKLAYLSHQCTYHSAPVLRRHSRNLKNPVKHIYQKHDQMRLDILSQLLRKTCQVDIQTNPEHFYHNLMSAELGLCHRNPGSWLPHRDSVLKTH